MNKTKNVYKKIKINFDNYINKDTGETLLSEQPNGKFIMKDENLVIIHSKEYVVIDSQALEYIKDNFTQVEYSRIIQMGNMVKGKYNLLHNRSDDFHTNDSLMEELEYTRNIFAKFMKKLYEKSVIYYIHGHKNRQKVTYIMLNPFLARKSKVFDKECILAFEDIRKAK